MTTRSTIRNAGLAAALSLASFAMTAGCAGPTKAGQEARSHAHDRMAAVNARVGYDQAKRAFQVGQLDRALREIDTAIERSPEQADFFILRGRILLEQHRLETALHSFMRAMELGEQHAAARPAPATSTSPGQRTNAKPSPTDRQHPPAAHAKTLAKAHYFAGIIHQRWSNHARAHEHYAQAFEHEPSNVQYLLAAAEMQIALRRYEDAQALIGEHVNYFEHNALLRHLLAQIALLQGEYTEAVRLLSEARLLNPDDPMLLEELARAQFAAGMYARCHESLRLLRRAHAELAPRNAEPLARPDLLQLEARCLVMMDRATEARALYMELTRLVPDDVDAWIEFGAVAFEIGDYRRVSLAGSRVVSLDPDRWEGYFLQAMHQRAAGGEEGAQHSARLLRRAATLARSATTREGIADGAAPMLPHLLLGRALEEIGDQEAAQAAYAQALRINPHDRQAQQFMDRLSGSRQVTTVPIE